MARDVRNKMEKNDVDQRARGVRHKMHFTSLPQYIHLQFFKSSLNMM